MKRLHELATRCAPYGAGAFLVFRGLAHSSPGMDAINSALRPSFRAPSRASEAAIWGAAILWSIATSSFVASGLGVLGVPMLRFRWRTLAFIGSAASLLLVGAYLPRDGGFGAFLDLAILFALWRTRAHRSIDSPAPARLADKIPAEVVP